MNANSGAYTLTDDKIIIRSPFNKNNVANIQGNKITWVVE